jgi:hypothetical protein
MTELAVSSSAAEAATAASQCDASALLLVSRAGAASAISATMAGEAFVVSGATSMLPPCGKDRSRVNAHFTAGMRRSNDISLESTGSCPRGTRREAIADSPAM